MVKEPEIFMIGSTKYSIRKVGYREEFLNCCTMANKVSLEVTGDHNGGFLSTFREEDYNQTYCVWDEDEFELVATFIFIKDDYIDEFAYPKFIGSKCTCHDTDLFHTMGEHLAEVNFISKMVVRDDYRRRGIGALILDYCISKSKGCDVAMQIMIHPYLNLANIHNAINKGFNMIDSTWYRDFGCNTRYALFVRKAEPYESEEEFHEH